MLLSTYIHKKILLGTFHEHKMEISFTLINFIFHVYLKVPEIINVMDTETLFCIHLIYVYNLSSRNTILKIRKSVVVNGNHSYHILDRNI